MTTPEYREPATAAEAVSLLGDHGEGAHLICGGTSMVLLLRQQLVTPDLLVGIRRIETMRGIRSDPDGSLLIGAATTHRTVERSPDASRYSPALPAAFGSIGTVRIRNQGTIGGNLAHADPAQDPPPILIALGASVEVLGPGGSRTIPIDEFFVDFFESALDPSELITAVRLPPRPANAHAAYLKFLPGSQDDYATVSIAASGTWQGDRWIDMRMACGSLGSTPMRIGAAEALVEGTALDVSVVAAAADRVAEAVDPISDVRGSADYKREMAAVWTRRALGALVALANGGRPG